MERSKSEIISNVEKMIKISEEKPLEKELFFFFGLPGAGKTTLAKKINERYSKTTVYLSTDMISLSQNLDYSDKYHWTFEIFDYFIDEYLSKGYSVIADTNADKYEIRRKYYKIAEKRDAIPYVFWVKADIEHLKERQEKRRQRDSQNLREKYLYPHTVEELKQYNNEIEKPKPNEEVYIINGVKDISKQLYKWERKFRNNKYYSNYRRD